VASDEKEAKVSPPEDQALTCYRCGTTVPADRTDCPLCREPQYHTCRCGENLRLDVRKCPKCGADWSRVVRIRHRARSSRLNADILWRYILGGAAIALIFAAAVKALVDYLAQRALPSGEVMPAAFLERARWAGQGLEAALRNLAGSLRDLASAVGPLLIVVLLGAAIGAGLYLYRKDFFSRSRRKPRRRSRRHSPH